MNTTINIENITTNIETGITTITLIEDVSPVTTIVEESVDIALVELGFQGPPGPTGVGIELDWNGTSLGVKREDIADFEYVELKGQKGDSLVFDALTEQQKIELRGDVGDTSINLTNIFLSSLLS